MASASTSTSATTAPESNSPLVLFARAVIARLSLWSALRLAITEGWGDGHGIDKRRYLASEIVDAFETVTPIPDEPYVEEILLEAMAQEFDMVLEDGSATVVAADICRLWDDAQTGKVEFVQSLEAQADGLKGKKVDAKIGDPGDEEEWSGSDESDGESGDSGEDEPAPQLAHKHEPEVDEDGFTMVKKKGRN